MRQRLTRALAIVRPHIRIGGVRPTSIYEQVGAGNVRRGVARQEQLTIAALPLQRWFDSMDAPLV